MKTNFVGIRIDSSKISNNDPRRGVLAKAGQAGGLCHGRSQHGKERRLDGTVPVEADGRVHR